MTPAITEDTPTEPTTPRSLAPPELDPNLLVAARLEEILADQARARQSLERHEEDEAHRQRETNATLERVVKGLAAVERTVGGLASEVHGEAKDRREREKTLSDQIGTVAQAVLTLGQQSAKDKAEILTAISGLKAESDQHTADLIKVDVARAKQDSIHEERLSVTEVTATEAKAAVEATGAQLAQTDLKVAKTETALQRVAAQITWPRVAVGAVVAVGIKLLDLLTNLPEILKAIRGH